MEPDRTGMADDLFARAQALHRAGRLGEAAALYRALVAAQPDHARALHFLGVIAWQTGDAPGGESLIRTALARRPDYAEAHHNLGLVLRAMGRLAEAAGSLRRSLALAPGNANALNSLGAVLKDRDDLDGALACFQRAVAVRPDFAAALRHLGDVLRAKGDAGAALDAYRRCLAIDPADGRAAHMAAALAGVTTDGAPRDYVVGLFDAYADGFDDHLQGRLGYRVPALVAEAIAEAAPGRRFGRALDLGCGTGLAGAAVRERVDRLDGVDLSPGMLAQARRKGLYDALVEDDVHSFLAAEGGPYDLMLAADVLIYVGRLDRLVPLVAARLGRGGLFAYSVESLAEGDCALRPTGRYAHGAAYLDRLAGAAGLDAVSRRLVPVRRAEDAVIEGLVDVWRRT